MTIYIILFLCLTLAHSADWNITPKKSIESSQLSKVYDINLDLPMSERYKQIFIDSSENIKKYIKAVKYSSKYLSFIAQIGFPLLEDNKERIDPEWYEYIEQLSEITNITLGDAFMLSLTYEIGCTSVIAQNNNNDIIMARSFDINNNDIVKDLLFEANYYKNGTLLYKGIEIAGFRGSLNAIKPNKFSIAINKRYDNRKYQQSYHLLRSIALPIDGFYTPNYLIMKVMETNDSFETAEEMLKKTELSSNAHYILSGVKKNEGAIIGRKQSFLVDEQKLDVDNGKWFIGVCNKDIHNENITDYRREELYKNMNRITRERINEDLIINEVLKKYPLMNNDTVYTSIHMKENISTLVWK